MHDLTILIPVRVDSDDRIENACAVLRHLSSVAPEAKIVVAESDAAPRLAALVAELPGVEHRLIASHDRFSKGLAVNEVLPDVDRPLLCVCDADVLVHAEALRQAVEILRRRQFRLVVPFNLICIDARGDTRARIVETLELGELGQVRRLRDAPSTAEVSARMAKGGVVLLDTRVALLEGGFNRHIRSYGWEDTELPKRLSRLGYPGIILRDFSIVHLDHQRGIDSRGNEYYERNAEEYRRMAEMSRRALRAFVDSDLAISAADHADERRRQRRRQRVVNLLHALPARAILNRLAVDLQIEGRQGILRRLPVVGRLAPPPPG